MLTLLELLNQVFDFGPLRLFGYTSTRAVGAAATAFFLMMVIMPRLIAWLRLKKFGEQGAKGDGAIVVDRMRQAKAGTPTMGGLGIIVCIAISAVLWCRPLEPRTWLLLLTLACFGFLGFMDDRTKIFKGAQGFPIRVKMALQLGFGLALGAFFMAIDDSMIVQSLVSTVDGGLLRQDIGQYQVVTNGLFLPFLPPEWFIPLGVLMLGWVLVMTFACSNGVNFTDGMDGLAGGTMLIAALAFMAIAYLSSHFVAAEYLKIAYVGSNVEVAVFCAATAGACMGFLWFNAPPAEVFMGDTGSQALGGVLAMIALCTKQEFLVLLVGFVFFMEALSVLLQVGSYKLRGGKRIFLCAPIHHHFQYKGWPETRIVFRFWLVAALFALLALATLKIR